jgi:L-alanine-DL-glutamate epimerase-like enolase superfamily enzyme
VPVAAIELWLVKIPLAPREPWFFGTPARFYPSWIPGFPATHMSLYLLKLTTDDGLEGCAAMNAIAEERLGLAAAIAPYLLGLDPLDAPAVAARMQELSYLGLRNGWIDAAFWDLAGKALGKPVWALLGGEGGRAQAYLSTGSVHSPERTAEIVKRAQDAGFRAVKLRVKSLDEAAMLRQVEAARRAGGERLAIMVDANQGWPVSIVRPHPTWDLDFAVRFARRLEDFQVRWLEEPLNRGDVPGLRALRDATKTPIAGGEINASLLEFQRLLEHDCLDIYQPDATLAGGTFAGGLTECWWVLREVLARGADRRGRPLTYTPHTWTNGFGFGVNLQLLGAVPRAKRTFLELPHEPPFAEEAFCRFLRGTWRIDAEGEIRVPDEPGLGVQVDWDVVRRFGKRLYRGDRRSIAWRTLLDRKLVVALELARERREREQAARPAAFRLPEPPFSRPAET